MGEARDVAEQRWAGRTNMKGLRGGHMGSAAPPPMAESHQRGPILGLTLSPSHSWSFLTPSFMSVQDREGHS